MSQLVIRPNPLPEPNGFEFFVNRSLSNSPKMYINIEQCADNVLAKSLLEGGKIKSIFLNEQSLKIQKDPEANWDEVFEIVETALHQSFPSS